jgi:hypothetical protein
MNLEKLGTGALAPLFCAAEAITSNEFFKKFNTKHMPKYDFHHFPSVFLFLKYLFYLP